MPAKKKPLSRAKALQPSETQSTPRRMGDPVRRPRKSLASSSAPLPWFEIAKHLRDQVEHLWPDMGSWLQDFLHGHTVTGNYRQLTTEDAIRDVLAIDPQKSDWLILEVLRHCHQAWVAHDTGDQHREARARARAYMKARVGVKAALTQIRSVLDEYPKESGMDLLRASLIMGTPAPELTGKKSPAAPPAPLLHYYDKVLACLEEAYSHKAVLGVNAGPFIHRYTVGPLKYRAALDQQKAQPDAALNGLIFALAFHFRRATSGQQGHPWQTGEEMPTDGEPKIPLIVHFAGATFPCVPISPSTVKMRLAHLRRHHVGLAAWPR